MLAEPLLEVRESEGYLGDVQMIDVTPELVVEGPHAQFRRHLGELAAVRPRVVVALGATAARAVLGRDVTVGEVRGRVLDETDARVVVTAHPSSVLRLRDTAERAGALAALVADLRTASDASSTP